MKAVASSSSSSSSSSSASPPPAAEPKQQPKAKRSKGPPRPPIFRVPEERRLFTLPNPSTGECLLLHDVQCFSLYNFVDVPDPAAAAEQLAAALGGEGEAGVPRPLEDFAGTVYLAKEGLNAQFCVRAGFPMAAFDAALRAAANGLLDGLGAFNMGDALPAGSSAPFKRFRVVARPQILTDGLLGSDQGGPRLDWRDAGPELSPAEWHQHLLASSRDDNDDKGKNSPAAASTSIPPVLLDCRNKYESDVGSFRGAEPLGTDTFAESWDALDKTVADLPKDTPVYTFCTGGIRCVKVNAYLKQRHGMSNLHRLQHGIIGYEKWLESESESGGGGGESLFTGANFIFDQRNSNKAAAATTPADDGSDSNNGDGSGNGNAAAAGGR